MLCIIEAMKLMNEIESETVGKIVQVLVEKAQPVEYGQALFVPAAFHAVKASLVVLAPARIPFLLLVAHTVPEIISKTPVVTLYWLMHKRDWRMVGMGVGACSTTCGEGVKTSARRTQSVATVQWHHLFRSG